MTLMQNFRAAVGNTVAATEGKIVFMFCLAMTLCSCWVVWIWWSALIALTLGGYVGTAQLVVGMFFEERSDDPWRRRTATLLAIGYIAIIALALRSRNQDAAYGAYCGGVAFMTTLCRKLFGITTNGAPAPTTEEKK